MPFVVYCLRDTKHKIHMKLINQSDRYLYQIDRSVDQLIHGVYLGVKTSEVFLLLFLFFFVAIVRVRAHYVDFFVFFHWWVLHRGCRSWTTNPSIHRYCFIDGLIDRSIAHVITLKVQQISQWTFFQLPIPIFFLRKSDYFWSFPKLVFITECTVHIIINHTS